MVEEFLGGEEASFISMVDGRTALPMATSQDHKRVGDGDTGPNTGGMGAYSPAPVVTPEIHDRILREIVEPTVAGMAADGVPFTGFLYAGLMIDANGAPKVIEFNARFGDPETQPILMRLDSDFVDLLEAGIDARLDRVQARWDPRAAVGVVMASRPYPEAPVTGEVISGLDAVPTQAKAFHAGTALDGQGRVVSSGGRVLCVTALGESVAQAQRHAYAGVDAIGWEHEFHRRDIGWRARECEQERRTPRGRASARLPAARATGFRRFPATPIGGRDRQRHALCQLPRIDRMIPQDRTCSGWHAAVVVRAGRSGAPRNGSTRPFHIALRGRGSQ